MVFLIITTLILTISVLKRVLNRDYVKITKDEIVIRQMRQEKHFIWKDVQRIKILEYTGPHGYGVRNVFVELYYDVSNPALYYYFSLSGTGAKSDDFVKQIVKLSGINRFAETQIIRERDVI